QPKRPICVHLGPGQKNYIRGWVNVDANPWSAKIDLWTDFSRELPFRDDSVKAIYSHHVIEHLTDDMIAAHFAEMYRVLIPGGVIRVGGPNLHSAIVKYLEEDTNWFSDFPRTRHSIGGKLANFIFCANEHLTVLTPSYLTELACNAGFQSPKICKPCVESNYFGPEVLSKECESDFERPHTILLEARKPSIINAS